VGPRARSIEPDGADGDRPRRGPWGREGSSQAIPRGVKGRRTDGHGIVSWGTVSSNWMGFGGKKTPKTSVRKRGNVGALLCALLGGLLAGCEAWGVGMGRDKVLMGEKLRQ